MIPHHIHVSLEWQFNSCNQRFVLELIHSRNVFCCLKFGDIADKEPGYVTKVCASMVQDEQDDGTEEPKPGKACRSASQAKTNDDSGKTWVGRWIANHQEVLAKRKTKEDAIRQRDQCTTIEWSVGSLVAAVGRLLR